MTALITRRNLLALLLAVVFACSVFTVGVFASEETTPAAEETTVHTEETTEATTGEETTGEETTGEETSEGATTESTTESGTAEETTTKEETTTENKEEAEKKKQQKIRGYINLGVGAAILIALAVLIFVYRAKIPAWWKGLKSECGKITWCPKEKLKKNTLVVVIIILVIAVAIGVLDFVFSRGMILLGDLFH